MKKKQPSNVFTIPNWMKNLRVREPEGTKTPDQVASSLELNMAFNDNDVAKLRACIQMQIPLVPLKHQKMLKAFLAMDDAPMVIAVLAFIEKCNLLVAELKSKETPIEPRREEIPAESGRESDHDPVRLSGDWDDDPWDRSDRSKPRTRGHRAVRAAKRKQAEA